MLKRLLKKILYLLQKPQAIIYRNKIGRSTYIRDMSDIRYCNIGRYCWINKCVGLNRVVMGNYCSIASHVLVGGMEHSLDEVSTSTRLSNNEMYDQITYIGNDVWIGTQVVVKQGVKIGNGAVIGANSFVNKDVPPYAIVVGSPAKIIRYRFSEDIIERIETSNYWSYPPHKAKQIIKSLEGTI